MRGAQRGDQVVTNLGLRIIHAGHDHEIRHLEPGQRTLRERNSSVTQQDWRGCSRAPSQFEGGQLFRPARRPHLAGHSHVKESSAGEQREGNRAHLTIIMTPPSQQSAAR